MQINRQISQEKVGDWEKSLIEQTDFSHFSAFLFSCFLLFLVTLDSSTHWIESNQQGSFRRTNESLEKFPYCHRNKTSYQVHLVTTGMNPIWNTNHKKSSNQIDHGNTRYSAYYRKRNRSGSISHLSHFLHISSGSHARGIPKGQAKARTTKK